MYLYNFTNVCVASADDLRLWDESHNCIFALPFIWLFFAKSGTQISLVAYVYIYKYTYIEYLWKCIGCGKD